MSQKQCIFEPMLIKPKCACQQEMYLLFFFYIFQLFEKNTLYHLTFIKRILASFLDFFYRGQQLYYYKSKRSAATDKKLYVPSDALRVRVVYVCFQRKTTTYIFSSRFLAYFTSSKSLFNHFQSCCAELDSYGSQRNKSLLASYALQK